MTPEDWVRIKHFRPDEKTPWGEYDAFGNPFKMNLALLLLLDRLRAHIGRPIGIHCGTQGKHSERSQHYLGRAVDCSCPGLNAWDFFLQAIKFSFGGIGVYSSDAWNNQGLHIDARSAKPMTPKVFWYAYKKEGKIKYEYF